MIKHLQSGWLGMLIGGILYLATTAVVWPVRQIETPVHEEAPKPEVPVVFSNPEIDELMVELRTRRESLVERENQLRAWEARLQAERSELTVITQMVSRAQAEFDKTIVKIRADEAVNLKRLAKTYTEMSPQAATSILKNQDDQVVTKVLLLMKDQEVAGILEQLSKLGDEEAKRASRLAERIRLAAANAKTK